MSHPHTAHHADILVIENTFYIDPSKKEEFFQHFSKLREQVIKEPECLHFTVTESHTEPGTYHQSESWSKDQDWYKNNQHDKPYWKEYLKATEKYTTKPGVTIVGHRLGEYAYQKHLPAK